MVDRPSPRLPWLSRRNKVKVIALAIALFTIGSITIQFVTDHHTKSVTGPESTLGNFGPKVTLNGVPTGSEFPIDTTITVQIFGAFPEAFRDPGLHVYNISPASQATNGYDDELLNATVSANVSAFFLSPTYDGLASDWATFLRMDQGFNYPALTVEAVKTTSNNGMLSLYQSYNNLPINPTDLSVIDVNESSVASPGILSWFNGTGINPVQFASLTLANLSFNLTLLFPSEPQQTLSSSPHAPVSRNEQALTRETPSSVGTPPDDSLIELAESNSWLNATTNTLVRTSFLNGTLPLIGVHFSNGADQGGSLINLGASVAVLNDSLNLDSTQVYVDQSGPVSAVQSTSPSYSHVANIAAGGNGDSYIAVPTRVSEMVGNNLSYALNQTTADVAVPGVEYEFQHFNRTTVEYRADPTPKLVKTTLDGNFTVAEIVFINTTLGLTVDAGYLPYYADAAISRISEAGSNGSVTVQTSGANSSFQGDTVWDETAGYSGASVALDAATGGLTSFPTEMGIGLTIAAFSGLGSSIAGSSEATVVADVLTRMATITGIGPSESGLFDAISVFSGYAEPSGVVTDFSDEPAIGSGSPYVMTFYETATPISFLLSSGAYSFFCPMDYLNATSL